MPIYDISLPLHNALAFWPGVAPYHYELQWRQSAGDSVNIGTVTMGIHTGTHADAPFHFQANGATIDQLPLAPFLGPAVVVDVSGRASLTVADFPDPLPAPRVLLRTNAWTDHSRFPTRFPVMEADVPRFLQASGVVLIGLDIPSVDAFDSKDLPNHHALAACGIAILEGLDLSGVPDGEYELVALPLKMIGADGAPCRAILRG